MPCVCSAGFITCSTKVVVITNKAFVTTTPEIALQAGIATDAWKQTMTAVINSCQKNFKQQYTDFSRSFY